MELENKIKTKTEELIEATLIIGARRANDKMDYDTAYPLIEQHIKHLSKRFDDLSESKTEELERRIKTLETICALAGVPEEVMKYFSKGEINEDDIKWAKNKINEINKK